MKILFLSTVYERNNPIVKHLESLGNEVVHYREKLVQSSKVLEGIDYIISYAYGYILDKTIVSMYKGRIINLHPSLLPWNKGRDPVFWSIWDETPKGVTIHLIDESIDTGDILVQEEIHFEEDETLLDCYHKANEAVEQLFIREWENIISGRIKPIPQPPGGTIHYKRDRNFYQNLNMTTVKDLLKLKQILQENNRREFPRDKTIHQLIEEQVEKTPNHIAIVCREKSLTYRELNERANQLAHRLREKGVRADQIVAIMANRSINMMVGILGILKAGGAYLPIDPDYPAERIHYMLEDSNATLLLTETNLIDKISFAKKVIDLQDENNYAKEKHNPVPINTPIDLAYVIYTSGSTGPAKGVMIEHHNLVNFSCWHADYFEVTSEDKTAVYSSFSFDGSLWDIFPYLISGSCLHIIDSEMRYDLERVNQYFEQHGITINFFPTAVFEQFNLLENHSLRLAIAGGDALKGINEKSSYKIYNGYGPTECTIATTTFLVDRPYTNIPIGKPIYNAKVLILDENFALQPIGRTGELFILGEGLGRGYINRPDLTAEKFVVNPHTGERMYRTGDLARWLPDGNIEYLGRVDNLVKIRGYRIEPGEVEAYLLQHPKIKHAAVGVKEDQQQHKYLVGYYVADETLSPAEVREVLAEKIPSYMIPSYFVQLKSLPLTPNGKVDRRALPDPKEVKPQDHEGQLEEDDETVKLLRQIWSSVLGVSDLSVDDNFLEHGGDSIKVIQLLHQMRKNGFEIEYQQLFNNPTIRQLRSAIKEKEAKTVLPALPTVPEQAYYAVSSVEKRMYAIQEQNPDSIAYNVTFRVNLSGSIKTSAVEKALQKLVLRHEVFRTSYHLQNGQVVKTIQPEVPFSLHEEERESWIGSVDEQISRQIKPFDLSQAPLLRAGLIRTSEEAILWIDAHHIVLDGVSKSIFLQELQDLLDGRELSPINKEYKDFTYWQNEWFNTEDFKNQLAYWEERLQGELPITQLPIKDRPANLTFDGAVKLLWLDEEWTKRLKKLAIQHDVTLFMMLLTVVSIWLSKYNSEDHRVLLGTVADGRQHPDISNVVGMFTNTLPLLLSLDEEKDLSSNVRDVKKQVLQSLEHQYVPFEKIVEVAPHKRERNQHPLFDVMFILQTSASSILEERQQHLNNGISKFDLTLEAEEKQNKLCIAFEYNTNLFDETTIEQLISQFQNILYQAIRESNRPIKYYELLTKQQWGQLFSMVNDTKKMFPLNQTILQIFEERVLAIPDQTALIYGEQRVTYQELNRRVNQLAHFLRSKGAQREDLIAIMADRSIEMVVGILGILKAGSAYLPLDPLSPKERLSFIFRNSGSKWLLTQSKYMDKASFTEAVIDLEDQSSYSIETSNPTHINSPNDLAYVLYTSGSTGQPKGVMIEHSSLLNILFALQQEYPLLEDDVFLFKTTYTFDVSLTEIFGWILGGGKLAILEPEAEKDPHQLWEAIIKYGVTHINFVPSMLSPFVDFVAEKAQSNKLRYIFSAGEAISADLVKKIYQVFPDIKLENIYGPTESTIYATKYSLPKDHLGSLVPIGKPLANIHAFILNKHYQLQPIGVPGELCLAGAGLARGYLNNAELTKASFIEHPFDPGKKLYKTGDLARLRADGNIEYLGRMDRQIKIRGFRIELDEIRYHLLQDESIRDAVVVARTDRHQQPYLCAYFLSEKEWTVGALRRLLESKLPEYMIPSYFVQMDQFPLTSSGKVDYKSLPEPDDSVKHEEEYIAPRNEMEKTIASIWADVLGLEKVGVRNNFFHLGGDSIKGLQIISHLNKLNLQVTLKDFFQYPTIEQLVPYVQTNEIEVDQGTVVGDVEFTPIQKYFFERVKTDAHHWNQAMMIYRKEGFDFHLVRQTMEQIVIHHDALRMVYRQKNGVMTQMNRGTQEGELCSCAIYDFTDEPNVYERIVEEANYIQASIDLQKGPLVKCVLFKTSEGDHLLIAIHHLVIDGVSWRILLEDFEHGYKQAMKGEPIRFPEKTHSYQTWAQRLKAYAQSEELLKEVDYWKQIDRVPVRPLPKDNISSSNLEQDTETASVKLAIEDTENLLRHAHHAYHTEVNDLLLTALGRTIAEWTGEQHVAIFMEGHGREEVVKGVNVTRTIGWFTSLFPVILHMKQMDLSEQIKDVKERLRAIPNKGIGYGILRHLTPKDLRKDLSFQHQPEIVFNYLGQFDRDLNTELFLRSDFPTGQLFGPNCERMHLLDLYAITVEGELVIHANYNKHEYKEETINNLLNRFVDHIKQVTEHCLQKEDSELTLSDFADQDLTKDELEEIADLIGNL